MPSLLFCAKLVVVVSLMRDQCELASCAPNMTRPSHLLTPQDLMTPYFLSNPSTGARVTGVTLALLQDTGA